MTRDLKVVSASMLTWGIGEGMFFIFQPLYIQQLGADPIVIGLILGINGLVMSLSQIPSGYLADKIGRRPLMWFSWLSGLAAAWIMALAPSLGGFVVGLMLYGITSSVMAPLNTYVQGARGKWTVGRAVSFVSATYNVGGVIGPLIGGVIAESFNLRSVYFAAGVLFTISTLIILFVRKQPVEDMTIMEGDGHLLRNRQFISLLAVLSLVMLAVTLPQPLTANFLQNQRDLPLGRIGQLGSLAALGSVLMMLVLGRAPVGLAMLLGQAGVLVFVLFIWHGGGFVWYGLGYLFLGGYRLCRAMSVALVQPVVREREVGLAFGMVETVNALAFMVAPILAGVLYDWRPVSVYPISLFLIIPAIILSLKMFALREPAKPAEVEFHKKDVCDDA